VSKDVGKAVVAAALSCGMGSAKILVAMKLRNTRTRDLTTIFADFIDALVWFGGLRVMCKMYCTVPEQNYII
jgi:hypothetical protein